jgi:hypothetical protein
MPDPDLTVASAHAVPSRLLVWRLVVEAPDVADPETVLSSLQPPTTATADTASANISPNVRVLTVGTLRA